MRLVRKELNQLRGFAVFFFRMFSMKVAGGHTHSSQKKMPSPILSDRSTTVCFKTNPFHLRSFFVLTCTGKKLNNKRLCNIDFT